MDNDNGMLLLQPVGRPGYAGDYSQQDRSGAGPVRPLALGFHPPPQSARVQGQVESQESNRSLINPD